MQAETLVDLDSNQVLAVRAVILYLPIVTAVALAIIRPLSKKRIAAVVISGCVALANLLVVNIAAQHFGWWSFIDSAAIVGMPADVWLGWAVVWGPLPALALPDQPRLRHAVGIATAAFALDLATMPLLEPVAILRADWLVGEFVALLGVLIPATAVSMLTLTGRSVAVRATIQAAGFTAALIILPPAISEVVLDIGFDELAARPRWLWSLVVIAGTAPAAMGLTALVDFVQLGRGTPVPLDPPKRLVTSGPYAYVSNPMQTSILAMLALYCLLLGHWLTLAGACGAFAFAAGLASHIEQVELTSRFGPRWVAYRTQVRSFLPRWRPTASDEPAVLWVGATCDICDSAGNAIFNLGLTGIVRQPAETCDRSLTRMTYEGSNGEYATGVAAIGRALEHANLAWAFLGWVLRLPVLTWVFQTIADGTGAGPQLWIPNAEDSPRNGPQKEIAEISA